MSPLLQHFSVGAVVFKPCGCCTFLRTGRLVAGSGEGRLSHWVASLRGSPWIHPHCALPLISSSLMNNLKCKIHRRNTGWPRWKSKCSQVSHLSILCQPKVNSSHASAVLYIWCLVVYIWYLVFLTSGI